MILTTGTPVRPFCGMVGSLYKHQYLLLLLLLLLSDIGTISLMLNWTRRKKK